MAPYLDFFGIIVVAELELTVEGAFVVVLEAELVVAVEAVDLAPDPEPVAVDMVVATVEFPRVVAVTFEVAVELSFEVAVELPVKDPDVVWAKIAADEEELMLEATEDAPETDEETELPLHEPEIVMLW
jgi:hypothetical protein